MLFPDGLVNMASPLLDFIVLCNIFYFFFISDSTVLWWITRRTSLLSKNNTACFICYSYTATATQFYILRHRLIIWHNQYLPFVYSVSISCTNVSNFICSVSLVKFVQPKTIKIMHFLLHHITEYLNSEFICISIVKHLWFVLNGNLIKPHGIEIVTICRKISNPYAKREKKIHTFLEIFFFLRISISCLICLIQTGDPILRVLFLIPANRYYLESSEGRFLLTKSADKSKYILTAIFLRCSKLDI